MEEKDIKEFIKGRHSKIAMKEESTYFCCSDPINILDEAQKQVKYRLF